MNGRIHSADALLRQYAETRSVLSGAKAQDMIAHTGGMAALLCATRDCAGSPRRVNKDGLLRWCCAKCKKLWPIEEKDLGRREFQDTRRGIPSIGELRVRLGDFAVILRRVQKRVPLPFTAWNVHVLAPTYEATPDEPAIGMGVPLDLVPERMQKLARAGEIDPLPVGGANLYRVRQWVDAARKEAMRQVMIAGV